MLGQIKAIGYQLCALFCQEVKLGCVHCSCSAPNHTECFLHFLRSRCFFWCLGIEIAVQLRQHQRIATDALNGLDEVVLKGKSGTDTSLRKARLQDGVAVVHVALPGYRV